jgi:hypothetical protein
MYKQKRGMFASPKVQDAAKTVPAQDWWMTYGSSDCPDLSLIAGSLLGLCASSSSCESIGSNYAFVHDKKRNRLDPARAEKLVFVYSNYRFLDTSTRRGIKGEEWIPVVSDSEDETDKPLTSDPIADADAILIGEEEQEEAEAVKPATCRLPSSSGVPPDAARVGGVLGRSSVKDTPAAGASTLPASRVDLSGLRTLRPLVKPAQPIAQVVASRRRSNIASSILENHPQENVAFSILENHPQEDGVSDEAAIANGMMMPAAQYPTNTDDLPGMLNLETGSDDDVGGATTEGGVEARGREDGEDEEYMDLMMEPRRWHMHMPD